MNTFSLIVIVTRTDMYDRESARRHWTAGERRYWILVYGVRDMRGREVGAMQEGTIRVPTWKHTLATQEGETRKNGGHALKHGKRCAR